MASTVALGARISGEHHNTKAAGRYLTADAESITDTDEDFCIRGDDGNSDIGGGGVLAPAPADARKQTSRPPSQGTPHQQSPLPTGRISSGQSIPVVSRPDSSERSRWTHVDGSAAAHGLNSSPLPPSLVQHSSGSTGSTSRRHPNGLPARQPSGPLPGMPFLSDLVSRYPMRQAPASGPQVALVSGQLYVSGRLREAMSAKKAPGQPSGASPTHGGFPAQDVLIPSYVEQMPSNYLQQRRVEKEQRAIYTGQHQQPSSSRPALAASDSAEPRPGSAHASLSAVRVPSATPDGTSRRIGGANAGAAGNARQRDVREGVERWLETNDSSVDQDVGGARPPTRHGSSNDPSLMYRQYGILRTYGKQSQGLWPFMSLSTASPNGQRVAFERKRTSSGASGSSPMRPMPQPVVWTPPRQSAW
ncbi:hypothetical protein Vafri_3438 [Volvox africanus]|uniref:Uncharacterized protein n=1 Tax=Volvox africanus TaxID=51714 RepID=A0A8J4ATF8_9CHLO|nr:hypothetical protein Vafri_3438 [Volvox africanus]